MLRSMYSGISGMKGFQTKLDVIGNNIANVNTIGFKKSRINFQDLLSQNLSSSGVNPMQVGLGLTTSSIDVVHTSGSLMTTGVGSDLAIMGDGFFVVQQQDENGNPVKDYLTRAGNFIVNNNGDLVTSQGYKVVGVAEDGTIGTINLDGYDSFYINRNGEVIGKDVDGTETIVSNIAVVTPTNPSGLEKVGGSMYQMTRSANGTGTLNGEIEAGKNANVEIASGTLEMSNVDLTEEFTEMIVAQRGFQANSRIITTSDEILQEVVNLKR